MSLAVSIRTTAMIAALALIAGSAQGARVASDNAADTVYNSAFSNGQNGGAGFGPWALSGTTTPNTAFNGAFVGDSGSNGANNGFGINTGGRAWALYANSNNIQNAVRPFTADSLGNVALTVGQRLSFSFDNGSIQTSGPAGSVGISLQTGTGTNRFELFFVGGGGGGNYQINDAVANNVNTGIPFTDRGLNVTFQLNSASNYTVTVTSNAVGVTPLVRTANLVGAPSTADIGQLRAFNFSAGSGNGANYYVNNLSISKTAYALTSAIPAAYGNSLGSLSVTPAPGNGAYNGAFLTGLSAATGYVAVNGFSPVTDPEFFALDVRVGGVQATPAQIAALIAAIGGNATATAPGTSGLFFGSGYNLFIPYTTSTGLPTGAQPYYFGFDFSSAAQTALSNVTIASIALIPAPGAAALLGLGGLLATRRRR